MEPVLDLPSTPAAEAATGAVAEVARSSVMDGVISGGWEYVGLAWGVSLALLAAYALFLHFRLRRAAGNEAD